MFNKIGEKNTKKDKFYMCIRNKYGKTRLFLSARNQASDTYHQIKTENLFPAVENIEQ